jgi:hypothetical protein
MQKDLYFDDVGLVYLDVLRVVLNNAECLFERGVGDKDRSDPVLDQAAGEGDDAIALDRLGHYGAGQQAEADLGRIVKPEEMLAAPARLQLGLGARDIAIEGFDCFWFQIDGKAKARACGESSKEEKEARQP